MSESEESRLEPRWLTVFIVERIHEEQIREHGGEHGVRDKSLLQPALSRPKNTFAYDKRADLIELAADYTFGIARNHPFVDGNKRSAFLAAFVFLDLNDLMLEAEEPEVVAIVVALSSGDIGRDEFATWLRKHTQQR
jgi:death-on-curing protein